ncbi:hypothetical protein F5Y16DRAFT_365052 [Xylariaceae sp. FL0255]|nr:hypothetical protein F5Y16DRAFT_365052 [Xylariaceae sp. FL0255]
MSESKETRISTSFISHLRQTAKVTCPYCSECIPSNDERIRTHLSQYHTSFIQAKDLNQVVREIERARFPDSGSTPPPSSSSKGNIPRQRSTSPIRRSRARPQNGSSEDPDFLPRPAGKLWIPELNGPTTRPLNRNDFSDGNSDALRLIKQPETRPITQEQLIAEVKGIYAGLVMVECKCIEVDNAQSSQTDTQLNNEQWQALIALHRTLLHQYHDFFLTSQYPSASQPLRQRASKYTMPARMWRHGYRGFLELLRHRLPGSMEHMLTSIYLAYSKRTLQYKTVPAFEDTWNECLEDIGRYRMATEDENVRDREDWASISRQWDAKAPDKGVMTTTGRLDPDRAVPARLNTLQQPSLYNKGVCVPFPFSSAREPTITLCEPGLSMTSSSLSPPIDIAGAGSPSPSDNQYPMFDGQITPDFADNQPMLGNSIKSRPPLFHTLSETVSMRELISLTTSLSSRIRRIPSSLPVQFLVMFATPAAASTIGRHQDLNTSSQQSEATPDPDGGPSLLWLGYPIGIVLSLAVEFAVSHVMEDHTSVHGLSMTLYGAAYVVFTLNPDEVPLISRISIFFVCAISLATYLVNDMRTLEPDKRQLAGLALITIACLLDFTISSIFSSSDSPTSASTFGLFLLPCMVASAFTCHCMRDLCRRFHRDPVVTA